MLGSGGTVYWNPNGGKVLAADGSYTVNSTTNLGHELLGHGVDANRGEMDNTVVNGLERNEWQATYVENKIRGEMGLSLREYYRVGNNQGTVSGIQPNMLQNGSPVPPPPLIPGLNYIR